MSLTEVNQAGLIANQVQYKLKAYLGVFGTLVIIQLLGVLFSFDSSAMSSTGGYGLDIEIYYYTADMVLGFTIVWGFIVSLLMTTKGHREDDFVFVTTRVTSNLSSIVFLFIASVIGGITAIWSGFLLQVLRYYGFGYEDVLVSGGFTDPLYVLMGVAATILFILLFSAFGYFVGMIAQLHRMLVVVLPVVFVGFLLMQDGNLLMWLGEFFFMESSFLWFAIKVLLTSVVLFAGAILMSNHLEVKR